jgi:hypothetical protein
LSPEIGVKSMVALRLAILCAAILALLVGVLLRARHLHAPLWAVAGRRLVVVGLGWLPLTGRDWARWSLGIFCLLIGWWYGQPAIQVTLPPAMRIGCAFAGLAMFFCALVTIGHPSSRTQTKVTPLAGTI